MWIYEKKLQYPVKIKNPNPQMAQVIMSQIGGADSETGAAMRYLNQRYAMPTDEIKGLLTDIGTEEPAPPSYPSQHIKKKQKPRRKHPEMLPPVPYFTLPPNPRHIKPNSPNTKLPRNDLLWRPRRSLLLRHRRIRQHLTGARPLPRGL